MDFTREPVIETIVTPKEGCKLVVRSSKGASHEEYFVDAVEVISFGNASFFRSLEKPKSFLVPVLDYEVLEVRETRMVLKRAASERSIKIAGGKAGSISAGKDSSEEADGTGTEKKREKRRSPRRKRKAEPAEKKESAEGEEKVEILEPKKRSRRRPSRSRAPSIEEISSDEVPQEPPNLIPPPPKLISETIAHYRERFKSAFYGEGEEPSPEDIGQIVEEGPSHPHVPPAKEEQTGEWDFSDALSEGEEAPK